MQKIDAVTRKERAASRGMGVGIGVLQELNSHAVEQGQRVSAHTAVRERSQRAQALVFTRTRPSNALVLFRIATRCSFVGARRVRSELALAHVDERQRTQLGPSCGAPKCA